MADSAPVKRKAESDAKGNGDSKRSKVRSFRSAQDCVNPCTLNLSASRACSSPNRMMLMLSSRVRRDGICQGGEMLKLDKSTLVMWASGRPAP